MIFVVIIHQYIMVRSKRYAT